MNKNNLIILFIFSIFFIWNYMNSNSNMEHLRYINFASAITFLDSKESGIIHEYSTMNQSKDDDFWLNSGALFYTKDNIIYTIQGDLPKYSPWRLIYRETNPVDTDNGYRPQNIFRLITREKDSNLSQSFYALIAKDNLSVSPNRNQSNGIFFLSRYQDSDTLYYSGIRVDGKIVIKKKKNGVYYTLSQVHFFKGDQYNKILNPSLLPKNKWIGLKTNIKNLNDGSVEIEFFLDEDNTGNWVKVLRALDRGQNNSSPILNEGHSGIRSDFMDIEIKDYSIQTLL